MAQNAAAESDGGTAGAAAAVQETKEDVEYEEDTNNHEEKKCSLRTSLISKCDNTRKFFWNSTTRQCLGRTWDSWAKIGAFYLIFYSSLAAFFAAMLAGFFSTIDNRRPTQIGMNSLIKSNPGMGYRPMPSIESTLIRFEQGQPKTYKDLVDNIETYMKEYKNRPAAERGENCSAANETVHDSYDTFCEFDIEDLGQECTVDNRFGYHNNKPCVLLKINKVYGWMPEPFTEAELNDTDNEFAQQAKSKLGSRLDPNYIGVTCEGENEGDADSLRSVKFYPEKGFAYKHFPYYNQPHYLPPVVFVQFDTPREGVLIQIWCKLWVRNIKHHKNDNAGSIHFELLVD